jgi:serine/threonine protein kinase
VHKSGTIYNDLKLQNILIDFDDKTQEPLVTLADFGFASSYLKLHGEHINERQSVKKFRGNLMFSSVNQMEFMTTSRRDDMIALCQLILYMLNDGVMPGWKKDYMEVAISDNKADFVN